MVRVLVCTVGLLLYAAQAWAQEKPAKPELPTKDEPLEVRRLDLSGVKAVDEGELRGTLATRPASRFFPWRDRQVFDVEAFKEDLLRIVAFYSDRGYRAARVTSYDVQIATDQKAVDLTANIDEGKPTTVGELVFEGFEPVEPDLEKLQKEGLPIALRAPLSREPAFATVQRLTALLKDRGYAYAKVEMSEESAGTEAVKLRFAAQPGPQAYFGPIEITGHQSVSDSVVRRQLTYKPGELFQRQRLIESQQRLYAVELFEFASIEILDEEKQPTAVTTRVTVAEGKHRSLDLSGGYGSEERLRGEVGWRHVNFFGGARTIAFRGKASALEQGGEVTFTNPAFYHPDLRLDIDGHNWWQDEPAYQLMSRGGGTSVSGAWTNHSSWRIAFDSEFTSSSITNEALADLTFRDELIALGLDPTTGMQRGLLTAVTLSAQHNTTDNILDPRRGSFAALTVENAGGPLPGKYNYTRVAGEMRGYVPLGTRAWIALRGRWTTVHPSNSPSDVPFFKRLFLGGATSLRGWGRFEVSPLSGSGLPIGGLSALESSGEIRFLATNRLIAVLFTDVGNVWSNVGRLLPRELRYDAGPGLRYLTPIGPIRFDLAFQLNPIEGLVINGAQETRHWRVHLGIGQSF